MNRQIKFRIWVKDENKMVYPDKYVIDFSWFGVTTEHYLDDSGTCEYPLTAENYRLMQFTGLKDKNEKEIYEGDILKTVTDKPMVVGWSEKFASFVLNRKGWAFSHYFGESCNPEDCEVIGNKYDNPELLQDINNAITEPKPFIIKNYHGEIDYRPAYTVRFPNEKYISKNSHKRSNKRKKR